MTTASGWAYVRSRALQLIPVLLVIVILNFALIRLAPGDPTYYLVGEATASKEYLEALRAQFGLDRSLPYQLFLYLGHVARGDLGYSYISRAPVSEMIISRLPATLLLMGSQFILAVALGVVLGVLSARKRGGLLDMGVTLVSILGVTMPVFWLGQMLMLVFSLQLGFFPVQGMSSLRDDLSFWAQTVDVAHHLMLPMMTLALFNLAIVARLTRANFLQIQQLEFVTFARSKGLEERVVLIRHILKNALLPVVTIIGLNVRTLIAGAVLTETVFAWPGLGRLTYDAVFARDYPVLMGMFVITGVIVVVSNILTDLAYALLDPRIRYG